MSAPLPKIVRWNDTLTLSVRFFFACCAIFMAALTRWPSLWVAISLNR